MKHAFTLIELIIIIILIGILAITVSPLFRRDTLIPATNQVLDHIRYTQQLALNQDMFVPSADFSIYPIDNPDNQRKKDAKQWFKKWWRIQFHNNNSYSVYSDHPTTGAVDNYDGQARNDDFVARDPFSGLFLFGDIAGNSVYSDDQRQMLVDLQDEYGVTVNVQGCPNEKEPSRGSCHLVCAVRRCGLACPVDKPR
jgi:type II secretory pathway pseudopilin PulG